MHGTVILNLGLALTQHDPDHRLGPRTTYPMVREPSTREPDLTWVRAERIPTDLNVDPDAADNYTSDHAEGMVYWPPSEELPRATVGV